MVDGNGEIPGSARLGGSRVERDEPVIASGVPQNYPDGKKLVMEDGIKAFANL